MERSRTGRGPLSPFKINYLDSALRGHLYQDDVHVSGVRADMLHFGGAKEMNGGSLVGGSFDGIMGLCPKGSRWGHETLLENLHRNGLVDKKMFSLWLTPHPSEGGSLTLGRVAEELTETEIHWFDAGKRNKWVTHLTSFQFGTKEFVEEDAGVAIDSGCTNIIIPTRAADAIHRSMGAVYSDQDQAWEVDCAIAWRFPMITLHLGKLRLTLKPDQYLIFNDHGCFSLFDGRDVHKYGVQMWILGCPFLRAYFTAYDMENKRFGVARPILPHKIKPQKCDIDIEGVK